MRGGGPRTGEKLQAPSFAGLESQPPLNPLKKSPVVYFSVVFIPKMFVTYSPPGELAAVPSSCAKVEANFPGGQTWRYNMKPVRRVQRARPTDCRSLTSPGGGGISRVECAVCYAFQLLNRTAPSGAAMGSTIGSVHRRGSKARGKHNLLLEIKSRV